jgi:hypothetical protein
MDSKAKAEEVIKLRSQEQRLLEEERGAVKRVGHSSSVDLATHHPATPTIQ